MGQLNSSMSVHKTRRRKLRSPFSQRSSKANLSTTFTMQDEDLKIELINVNLATEEELMTLPGISRIVAQNIVEHRKAIGRFKKVEDVALVKGIGADKLHEIRPEICVNRRKNQSCASSRAQSLDSLDSRSTYRCRGLLDINKASVFELQCVHGLTQELAANIVHYRTKKGPFKQLDDLIKVQNMDQLRLSNIRPFLTCGLQLEYDFSGIMCNNNNITTSKIQNGIVRSSPVPQRKSSTIRLSTNRVNGLSNSSIEDIFELLSTYSSRPPIEDGFHYVRNGEKAIRIASWNLQEFTYEKACNLGVKEVICRTILENKWAIIALQEVQSIEALRILCEELNKPRLRRISEWKENNHQWHYCYYNLEHYHTGFIYDLCSGGIEITLNSLDEINLETSVGLLADFQLNDYNLSFLNVNFITSKRPNIEDTLMEALNIKEVSLFTMGTFESLSKEESETNNCCLMSVLPMTTNTTTITNARTLTLDNILVNSNAQSHLTGIWGVVRQGLHHLAIPCGWSWGGPVSSHCPVWTEIYVSPNVGTAL